ncbi:hypothetical protein LAWI1_G005003, partial [Lachnellula willkommii]
LSEDSECATTLGTNCPQSARASWQHPGQLIHKITVELQENGEAAPEYQHLLLELEALDRALKQLHTLQPAKHELLQLNAIRAIALSCQLPLQEFLGKISKFEHRLGVTNARDQRFRGLHRRMQWRLAYKDDVKKLRSKLGSFFTTISLLLMTQTVSSVTAAEHERDRTACTLQESILAHRRLIEDVKTDVGLSLAEQKKTKSQLQNQADSINDLHLKSKHISSQLQEEHALVQEVKSITVTTEKATRSILSAATDTLTQATLSLLTLRDLTVQLQNLVASFTKFTIEMRE